MHTQIKTKDDTYYIFACGHGELNPAPNPSRKGGAYICSQCGWPQHVTASYIQCQNLGCTTIIRRVGAGHTAQYCEACQRQRKQDSKLRREKRIKNFKDPGWGDRHCKYEDIAEELGVSKQRAQQITNEAVTKFIRTWIRFYGTPPDLSEHVIEPYKWGSRL